MILLVALGRCELCKTKFRFDPQYAENAPDHLPAYEVVLGLSSRFLAKWLPLALRILIAATLWLIVAPLLTACLYHGWMHRPSSVLTRWSKELIPGDIVSGAIIVAIIIISFLSLMSFADFLRVHWGEPENEAHRRRRGHANEFQEEDNADNENAAGIDDTIVDFEHEIIQRNEPLENSPRPDHEANGQASRGPDGVRQPLELTIRGALQRATAENADHGADHDRYNSDSDSDYIPEEEGDDDEDIDEDMVEEEDVLENPDAQAPQNGARNDNRPFDPMDPMLQDDQAVSVRMF